MAEARRLIDQGQLDKAVATLEELKRENPNPDVTETLGSAYAVRAGVRVENYWGFLVGFRAPILNSQKLVTSPVLIRLGKVLGQIDDRPELEGGEGLAGLARFFAVLDMWRERVNSLPIVEVDKRPDLDRAISVLADHPKPGARLYRALLQLIALKSDLGSGFSGWSQVEEKLEAFDLTNPDSAANHDLLCSMDLTAFREWTALIMRQIGDAASDLRLAYPSKAPALTKAVVTSEEWAQKVEPQGEACP